MNEQHIIEAIKDATDIEAESVEAAVDQLIDYHFDVAMGLQNDCNTYKAEIERLKAALESAHHAIAVNEIAIAVNAERGNAWKAEHDALEAEVEHLRYWAMLGASAVEDARDALHMWDLNAPGSDEHGLLLLSYRFSESYGWSEVAQLYAEVEQLRWPDEPEMCDCGNYPVKPGLRVCDSCEFARDMYPDLFEDDEPDELESAAS